MLEHLRNPEYLHVLLNPLPIYGLAMGLLGLIVALISRARAGRVVALSIIFVSAISAGPVRHYGEASYDRVLSLADSDGGKWLAEHQRRAEKLIWLFYALATVAVVALLCERFAPRAALTLALTSAVLASATLGAGAYIGSAGGRIRHREFRYVPAPEKTAEQ